MQKFKIIILLITCSLHSLGQDTLVSDSKDDFDSDLSFIHLDTVDTSSVFPKVSIKNITYNIEEVEGLKSGPSYICKTTTVQEGDIFYFEKHFEKKELFDFSKNKIFEISVENRKLVLFSRYYIAIDLSSNAPLYFELYDYKKNIPIIKCTDHLWSVEIPDSYILSYFGYQKAENTSNEQKTNIIGSVFYFSLYNGKTFEIELKSSSAEVHKNFSKSVDMYLEPKNSDDIVEKHNYKSIPENCLTLWSKKGINEYEKLEDFDIVLEIGKYFNDDNPDNNLVIKKRIPMINGLPFGEEPKNGKYEIILN